MLKKFRLIFFIISISAVAIIEVAFSPPQNDKLTVSGRAIFDFRKYPNQKVKVTITEDGKFYKTVYSDDRGNYSATISLNHKYMFNMSMDYHGTSKVYIDTRVPEIVLQSSKGGYFEFKCPLYERYEGLNMGILNNPLMKMKYIPKKDKFEFNKGYSDDLLIDMDGFLSRLESLELHKKKVLKDGKDTDQKSVKPSKKLAGSPELKKERKVIVFEDEIKKSKAENIRGHRNIMEVFDEKEEVAQFDEIEEVESEIGTEVDDNTKDEEVEENIFAVLNIAPKRILIEQPESNQESDNGREQVIETEKMKIREAQEITRIEEETKIRERVQSFNRMVYLQKVKIMTNKNILTDRLRNLIKTIALAEVFIKKKYFSAHPINHNELIPTVLVQKNENWWSDQEKIMIRYPNGSTTFRKNTYLFGITYYYIDEKETDEDTFCSNINSLSKNNYTCAN